MALRLGLLKPFGFIRHRVKEFFQARVGLARGDKFFPLADCLLHGSQCAPHNNGSRNHDPGGDLPAHGKVSAGAQDGHLEAHAHELGARHDGPGPITCLSLGHKHTIALNFPALGQSVLHAHGANDFGILHCRPGKLGGLLAFVVGCQKCVSRQVLIEKRQSEDHHSTAECHPTQPRMEGKTQSKKNRGPGHIEKRQHTLAGNKAAHLIRIPQGRARPAIGVDQLHPRHAIKKGARQNAVKLQASTHEHARAHKFQHAIGDQKRDSDHCDHHKRHFVSACQHPIIDLEHVKRPHEHQQVHKKAEQNCCAKNRAKLLVGFLERIGGTHRINIFRCLT